MQPQLSIPNIFTCQTPRVSRFFRGTDDNGASYEGWYDGTVVNYDAERGFYRVHYDDGDQEDLELVEVLQAVAYYYVKETRPRMDRRVAATTVTSTPTTATASSLQSTSDSKNPGAKERRPSKSPGKESKSRKRKNPSTVSEDDHEKRDANPVMASADEHDHETKVSLFMEDDSSNSSSKGWRASRTEESICSHSPVSALSTTHANAATHRQPEEQTNKNCVESTSETQEQAPTATAGTEGTESEASSEVQVGASKGNLPQVDTTIIQSEEEEEGWIRLRTEIKSHNLPKRLPDILSLMDDFFPGKGFHEKLWTSSSATYSNGASGYGRRTIERLRKIQEDGHHGLAWHEKQQEWAPQTKKDLEAFVRALMELME